MCGKIGHYARDCKKKKGSEKAFLASGPSGSDDGEEDLEGEDIAYVTTVKRVLFSRDYVLLDSQASVNVFCNRELLSNVRQSEMKVVLNGVQAKASGVASVGIMAHSHIVSFDYTKQFAASYTSYS